MKIFITILMLVFTLNAGYTYPLNRNVYDTIPAQRYRNHYYRQTMHNGFYPNYNGTRSYQNYSNYTKYMNSINQYNYDKNSIRGMR